LSPENVDSEWWLYHAKRRRKRKHRSLPPDSAGVRYETPELGGGSELMLGLAELKDLAPAGSSADLIYAALQPEVATEPE
jgi:hypothetical protein